MRKNSGGKRQAYYQPQVSTGKRRQDRLLVLGECTPPVGDQCIFTGVTPEQRMTKAYIPPERKIPGVGVGVGQCTRCQNFALPNAKYTNMLVYFALGNAHFRVLPDAFYPTRFTRCQSVEYRWHWAFWRWGWHWPCTFHIFCVDFICVWWSTQSQYPVEYGLKTFQS